MIYVRCIWRNAYLTYLRYEEGLKPTRVFVDRRREWSTSWNLRETVLFTRETGFIGVIWTSAQSKTIYKYDLITRYSNIIAIVRVRRKQIYSFSTKTVARNIIELSELLSSNVQSNTHN